jgi:hypothetical protein
MPGTKEQVEIKSYLGSERTYWHGNSVRVGLPIDMVERLEIKRGTGKFIHASGEKKRFLFFETDKGYLLKVVDKETEEKLKGVLQFADFSKISDKDLKLIFG